MQTKIKINTAFFICAAFLFRLIFINVGLLPSSNTSHNQHSVKKHFTSKYKRRKSAEISEASNASPYSVVEICEEVTDEETESKSISINLIQVLYSYIGTTIQSGLSNFLSFQWYTPYHSNSRYLNFQVFRI